MFVTGSRAADGTGVFVGTRETTREQMVMEGNSLGKARSQLEAGATHIHMQ